MYYVKQGTLYIVDSYQNISNLIHLHTFYNYPSETFLKTLKPVVHGHKSPCTKVSWLNLRTYTTIHSNDVYPRYLVQGFLGPPSPQNHVNSMDEVFNSPKQIQTDPPSGQFRKNFKNHIFPCGKNREVKR